jgi:hypothetical protein
MEKMRQMISDDMFAYMVSEDVKNKLSPAQKATLMQKENWSKWQKCLIALIENLDGQLEDLDEDEDADMKRFSEIESRYGSKRNLVQQAQNSYASKKIKIERFKFHVSKKLDDVTRMIETGSLMESNGWEQVEFFKRAIYTHRKMLTENDMEPTSIDEALWASLQNKWEFDNIDTSSL